MPDSSDIGNALIARLGGDATLLALAPNGVYFDVGPPGSTRFVVVSLVDEVDAQKFGGRSHEDTLFSVEVRMLSTVAGANPKAAAARIDVLLEDQPLTVTGYAWMAMYRESYWRKTEPDEVDPSILWYRRGGHYRVQMSVGAT